MNTRLIFAKI